MRKTKMILERRDAWTGFIFILPWFIGSLVFFAQPIVQSVYFMFSEVTLESGGFQTSFTGFANIEHVLLEDPNYIRSAIESLSDMLYEVPLIILLSLFLAVLLNQRFRGRVLVRAIFFLPVIISSGVVMQILKSDVFASSLTQGDASMFQSVGLQDVLIQMGIGTGIVNYFTSISNHIFELLWKSGIQILLFLAGLQTVPRSLYEASSLEGATAWEDFWKITLPMISPIVLVNLVYSVVDSFTDYGNSVMRLISDASKELRFSVAASMSWIYFISVFIVIGIIVYALSKKVFYSTSN